MKNLPLIAKVQESATGGVVSGGAAAVVPTPLFATIVRRSRAPKIKVTKQELTKKSNKKSHTIGIKEAFDAAASTPELDHNAIISRLKSLEKRESFEAMDTTSFGLEDERGGIVKVTVNSDQAADFEQALRYVLTDDEDQEIAEVLFQLKDQFDIVDVDWGDFVEDEEEIAPLEDTVGDGDLGVDPDLDSDIEDASPLEDVPPVEADTDETSILTQVIAMMKADAEARVADAEARKAEAAAKEAEAMSVQAAAKVRQEEQILDMETREKEQKEVAKEARRLAKLAKMKHDLANERGLSMSDTDVDDAIPGYTDTPPSLDDDDDEYDENDSVRYEDSEEVANYRKMELINKLLSKMGKKS